MGSGWKGAALCAALMVGFIDDRVPGGLRPRSKLAGQGLAGLVLAIPVLARAPGEAASLLLALGLIVGAGVAIALLLNGRLDELAALCAEVCVKLGISTVDPDRLRISNEVLGSAYGDPTRETVEAVRLVARSEGILLDPVYSGKAMAGLIAMIRRGELSRSNPAIFLHTGGSAALFAYRDALTGTR